MKRVLLTAAVFALSATAVMAQQEVAVEQQKLMRSMARGMYGTMLKTMKGETPYNQATIDAVLTQLEQDLPKIATTFATNPKQDVVDATYGSSQKIWQNKADFDSKIPPVTKAVADQKGKIKDTASLKVAFDTIEAKCNECHETYRVKLK